MTLLIIFLLFTNTSKELVQTESNSEVFLAVVMNERSNLGLYVQRARSKTYFDTKEFIEETNLTIPKSILLEIEDNSNSSSNSIWDKDLLKNINVGTDFIKSKKLLSKEEIIKLFDSTRVRQNVLSISQPIFDNQKEHCVVSISYWKYHESFYGHNYLLKRIYGKWIIIETFGYWIT